ncbi:MAG TPA: TonB-dependent receptor, partial [Acidobacteriota bacterium]|nr:TonB-dependent receptor [Acidobacteriota bacterium]
MSPLRCLRTLCLVLLFILYSAPVAAQLVTGTITGTVVDATRSNIPGASVILENQQTGEARNTVSNDTGNFVFTAVPPGTYRVAVEIPGFKRYEQSGIVLSANERLPLGSIVLEVGELSDSVTVSAEGAAVQSESSELSAQLTSTQMESMAIRGRDVVAFLRILPGVAYGADVESPGGNFGTASTSINGTRPTGNVFFLDGVPGMDMSASATFSSTISFDAISEVKVLSNSYRAEHGSNGGAVVDVVTKGGTRDFHGSAYWYKRHENLNANDFFRNQQGVQKPLYRYSTLGGSIGGPILLPGGLNANRDKLFFFYSIENWLSRVP